VDTAGKAQTACRVFFLHVSYREKAFIYKEKGNENQYPKYFLKTIAAEDNGRGPFPVNREGICLVSEKGLWKEAGKFSSPHGHKFCQRDKIQAYMYQLCSDRKVLLRERKKRHRDLERDPPFQCST
jgi:hypothetical protein